MNYVSIITWKQNSGLPTSSNVQYQFKNVNKNILQGTVQFWILDQKAAKLNAPEILNQRFKKRY